MKSEIFAVYFPSWHPDRHYGQWYGKGFSEWELMKTVRPLFPGHRQPRKPLWGYFDESDPAMMERQIDLAADSGLTGFLFDWYWYGGERFLEQPLDCAFLQASNRRRMKFALMWANHDWGIWPALDDARHQAMNGNANQSSRLLLQIAHSEADLERVADYCSEMYFRHDNYWKIDGRPVFSFFDSQALFRSVPAARVVQVMNDRVRRHGFPGLYLLMNVGCCNDNGYFCGWGRIPALKQAGVDAVFAYNIVAPSNYRNLPREHPVFDYSGMAASQEFCWDRLEEGGLTHFPSVTLGLDVSPRWSREVRFPMDYLSLGYCPICTGNTPGKVGEVLKRALARQAPAVIINAWNEWTEGMALLPDEEHGCQYLETIRNICRI